MGAVTRRAVLSGLAASAALVAACGPGAPQGVAMRDGSLRSSHWPGREVRWRLAVPDRAGAPPPTVVVLHGRGGNADNAFDDQRVQDHVARTGLAVASVDGGNHWWHPRRSGIDTAAMVREDFLPLLSEQTGYAGPLALLGWSMGGYGALLLASELGPARVGAVVAASAALWTSRPAEPPEAFDDDADFARHDVFRRTGILAAIPVRLDCGDRDSFLAANRAFARALPTATLTVDRGDHSWDYWRGHAGAQLDWVAARLGERRATLPSVSRR
ncbi:MAG TPA: alpha/beta fold hydrolase [Pedococcus sp.]|jgi:S-formylglutathione hydrolase FrmB|uniref:alpha/beta hydrolase n=1 Tax=Pedococcus sp. TaxID=2860345 RepID=UPI002F91C120